MKAALFITLFILGLSGITCAQNYTFEEDSLVKINGQKICTILKTKKANIMAGTIAEFTVFDVQGIPRFLFEGTEGRIVFLDDNRKSFLPRVCDAYAKELAAFFGNDSILTPQGYNTSYRDAFIKKYRGFNASAATRSGERNRKAPVSYIETQILQEGTPIGSYQHFSVAGNQNYSVHVFNPAKQLIAKINVTAPDKYNNITVTITDHMNKPLHTLTEFGNNANLYKKGIQWLVANGHL